MSVGAIAVRGEASGAAVCFHADVAAVAKASLPVGTILDGEGGATIYGGLRPAEMSVKNRYLPLGLANKAPPSFCVCCMFMLQLLFGKCCGFQIIRHLQRHPKLSDPNMPPLPRHPGVEYVARSQEPFLRPNLQIRQCHEALTVLGEFDLLRSS